MLPRCTTASTSSWPNSLRPERQNGEPFGPPVLLIDTMRVVRTWRRNRCRNRVRAHRRYRCRHRYRSGHAGACGRASNGGPPVATERCAALQICRHCGFCALFHKRYKSFSFGGVTTASAVIAVDAIDSRKSAPSRLSLAARMRNDHSARVSISREQVDRRFSLVPPHDRIAVQASGCACGCCFVVPPVQPLAARIRRPRTPCSFPPNGTGPAPVRRARWSRPMPIRRFAAPA